ncbi:TetR family transcriptional regulator [Actinorhabdospora filicis]|uniref:TetR family transcriptional regulator n=1 Tax=Actinorhabdospora filicis TaxID=1785913 RepID=A0A9W6SNN1_9ACTN|nr:TetR/AcrR family transcriptional regulator [Actinorhabdospora filicis]GLZ79276.1 TetR family transcriptional regulator [Actinorhabdospora filicis]
MPTDVSPTRDRPPREPADPHAELLAAGIRVLREEGAVRLTLRRVAGAAGTSTMGIYTCFGGRAGLLEAIYDHGFGLLRRRLSGAVTAPAPPLTRILAVAAAYREFALTDPALYALMFERPLPDFDPPARLKHRAMGSAFALLVGEVTAAIGAGALAGGDPERVAYLLWTAMHGLVSVELTHAARGWILDGPDEGGRVLVQGMAALLSGLAR